jgi:putative transposase
MPAGLKRVQEAGDLHFFLLPVEKWWVPHISHGEMWEGCILAAMPVGLKRVQEAGDLHFVTFSCYGRAQHLVEDEAKNTFEACLETMREKYSFAVVGYVVMPEHVHLLLSEPADSSLATVLQAVKISVSKRLPEKPFWQRRYYDFNVFSSGKQAEKLEYMHLNPVTRGLVGMASDWKWSSHHYYTTGVQGTVQVSSGW